MSVSHIPTTPFPNVLLDDLMPKLSDTEWRLLCVVVRATWGWQGEGGQRKSRDWLTHTQLRARTGRASAAVSQAVQSLITKGLLQVEDSEGIPLTTTAMRRAVRSRLYFRVAPNVIANISESEIPTPQSVAGISPHTTQTSETENHKAKTTKEKEYKTLSLEENEMIQEENIASRQHTHSADVLHIMRHYAERFREHSPRHLPPPLTWSREGTLMSRLLGQYDKETLIDLLDAYFRLEDKWVKEQGYSLTAFRHRIPQLLMQPIKQNEENGRQIPNKLQSKGQQKMQENTLLQEDQHQTWRFDKESKQFVAERGEQMLPDAITPCHTSPDAKSRRRHTE